MGVQSRGWRWTRAIAAVVAAFALVGSGAVAASAAPVDGSSATASISGTVTDARTGAGVADASIVVLTSDGAEAAATSSGSTGGYTVSGLEPGEYRVSISAAPSHEPVFWPSAASLGGAEVIALADGEARTGVDVALVAVVVGESVVAEEPDVPAAAEDVQSDRAEAIADEAAPEASAPSVGALAVGPLADGTGSIAGTVTREDTGAPVAGVVVSASSSAGYGNVLTGVDGSYEIGGLALGDYLVSFQPAYGGGLAGEYWMDAYAANDATLVSVVAGAATTAIDASLTPAASISGTVRRSDTNEPLANVNIWLVDGKNLSTSAGDGTFSMLGVAPGEHTLLAVQYYMGTAIRSATYTFTVGAGDSVTGVDLALSDAVDIRGYATAEDPGGTGIRSLGATAYRWSGTAWYNLLRITGWGDYRIGGLPEGTYTVGFDYPGHCTQYWDGKLSLDDADSFALAPGETRSGIDAYLTAECDTPAVVAGTPTISGPAQVGETLTAVPGTWAPDPVELAYEWLADGTPIAGETGSTLALTVAQEGANISVRVTGSRPGHTSATATSAPVGPVVAAPLPPVTAGTPTISGSTVAGSTLTAAPGTWTPGDVALAYQWNADGVPVVAATGSTFVTGDAEVGKTITVTVTGSKSGYAPASATSAAVGPITAAPLLDLAVGTPSIDGTPTVGEQLTAVAGTWGPAPVALAYQWLLDGAPVAGATGTTFTLYADAAGKTVTVTVRGTKPGYNPASATSAPVGPVALATLTTDVPVISGTPRVGEPLTAGAGEWGPAPVELSYQWSVGGTPVDGATGETFTPDAAHVGQTVAVAVTGTKPGYAPATEVSAPTVPVAPGILDVSDPKVAGTLGVGRELVVDASAWGPAPVELSYQWLADGEPIEGANGDRFTPDAGLVGAELSVTVSATKPGYEPAERTVVVGAVPPSVTVSTPRAQRGEGIVVTGEHFIPGEDVLLQLHSDPIDLTTVVADDEGAFTVTVTVPAGAELGQHDVVATGLTSGLVGSAPLEVYENAPVPGGAGSAGSGSPAGGLATTGDELPTLALSLGLMMVAAGLVLARRRRVLG